MPTPSFVHLRLHSEYSVSDGIVRIDDAVSAALADGMPALGLTDLANMFGMVKFYQEARGKGLKPVIGCDVWVENTVDRDKPFRLLESPCRRRVVMLCEGVFGSAQECIQFRGLLRPLGAWQMLQQFCRGLQSIGASRKRGGSKRQPIGRGLGARG